MAIPNPGCCSCMLKNSISIFRHFNIMTLSCHKSIAISYLRKSSYIKKGYLIEVSLIMIYRVFFYSVETKKAKSKINDEIKSGVGQVVPVEVLFAALNDFVKFAKRKDHQNNCKAYQVLERVDSPLPRAHRPSRSPIRVQRSQVR